MAAVRSGGSGKAPNVLTVAGSDSGGGAGVQADLKTFAALGVYGCTAITALTAQNTDGVRRAAAVSAAMVEAQMEAVFSDMPISAVKIGLLPTGRAVHAVAKVLARHAPRWVVYDPVMTASTGHALQADSAIAAVRSGLLPRATVVTPNVAELARLTETPEAGGDDGVDRAARRLLAAGPEWVLVTGGDRPGRFSRDRLHGPRGSQTSRWFRAPRIETRHGHGTGCTLSSAIAARLALGDDVPAAVEAAKAFVGNALAAADDLDAGRGSGPLNHFYATWRTT